VGDLSPLGVQRVFQAFTVSPFIPHPRPTGAVRPIAFVVLTAVVALSFICGLWGLLYDHRASVLAVTGAYLIYEIGISVLLASSAVVGVWRRSRRRAASPDGPPPAMSVLIAAHNERICIEATVESVREQQGVDFEIIIASDGSADGTGEFLIARYAMMEGPGGSGEWLSTMDPRLKLLVLPRIGKGHALNAALREAKRELVATLDADTRLEPGALASLASTFLDPSVASAGGFIYIRNAGEGGPWLARYQYWEYLKNFIWRIGLVEMDVCLQVSGAFGGFRTAMLRELGGFDGASSVEDYEIIFRLHERLRLARRADRRVEVAPGAVALTDGPETPSDFVRQRTRWFAGFLQTLWDYRRMVGDRRLGPLGWLLLPIKCIDALLPIWGVLSLTLLLAALATGIQSLQISAVALFGGKVLIELANAGVVWACHRALFGDRNFAVQMWPYILTEGLVFHWFRQIAVLRAYRRFRARQPQWEQPGRACPREVAEGQPRVEIPCNLPGSIGYVPPPPRTFSVIAKRSADPTYESPR
jgi:cellulose synthase/poly-beta-1,6-N-acetylglucosamine synthase-like glycosyltransferase